MKTAKKIALLGFDCALTNLVRRHIEEGLCPNFKKIFENGTVAENCLVPFPTITPPNWTSMATGAWPGTNNVTDFFRHIPGTTPEGANAHNAFNWDYVQAESFWEAAEKAGKKSVILNYPMSFNAHKRLKHGTVVGGGSLTVGVYMDGNVIADYKKIPFSPTLEKGYAFCDDTLVCTQAMPGNSVKVSFSEKPGWANVDNPGDDPLGVTFKMPFSNSIFNKETTYADWHLLVRNLGGDDYDTVTLSPSKDFKDAFFTIKKGEWSKPFLAEGVLENGGTKTIRMMAKLTELGDEGDSFRLFLTHALNIDGDFWCYPREAAAKLNKGDNVGTNNTGMTAMNIGWIDLDTWLELVGIHYDWMGDSICALLGHKDKPEDWDVFFTHAHPTDFIYHALMTELDAATCSSEAMHKKAWELHRELYRHADRYLGRILECFDDETLIVLISDHGATPDGPFVDMNDVLGKAGLLYMKAPENTPSWLANAPENIRVEFMKLVERVDTSKSKAMPQRICYAYVNLKGRDPEGIVEPEDYEKVQREIIDAMMSYRHPKTGKCPFILALPKREAALIGLWGDQVGDVVYALWPEYSMQHGPLLPTSGYGIGDLRTLCVYYGPEIGVKKGYSMERRCNLVDLAPTFCYMTGWPVPEQAEGSVVYQIMEDTRPVGCR